MDTKHRAPILPPQARPVTRTKRQDTKPDAGPAAIPVPRPRAEPAVGNWFDREVWPTFAAAAMPPQIPGFTLSGFSLTARPAGLSVRAEVAAFCAELTAAQQAAEEEARVGARFAEAGWPDAAELVKRWANPLCTKADLAAGLCRLQSRFSGDRRELAAVIEHVHATIADKERCEYILNGLFITALQHDLGLSGVFALYEKAMQARPAKGRTFELALNEAFLRTLLDCDEAVMETYLRETMPSMPDKTFRSFWNLHSRHFLAAEVDARWIALIRRLPAGDQMSILRRFESLLESPGDLGPIPSGTVAAIVVVSAIDLAAKGDGGLLERSGRHAWRATPPCLGDRLLEAADRFDCARLQDLIRPLELDPGTVFKVITPHQGRRDTDHMLNLLFATFQVAFDRCGGAHQRMELYMKTLAQLNHITTDPWMRSMVEQALLLAALPPGPTGPVDLVAPLETQRAALAKPTPADSEPFSCSTRRERSERAVRHFSEPLAHLTRLGRKSEFLAPWNIPGILAQPQALGLHDPAKLVELALDQHRLLGPRDMRRIEELLRALCVGPASTGSGKKRYYAEVQRLYGGLCDPDIRPAWLTTAFLTERLGPARPAVAPPQAPGGPPEWR